jgi:hypothetical protein
MIAGAYKSLQGASMIRQIVAPTVALFLAVMCLLAEGSDIKLKGSEPFIGTWELVSTEERMTDGSRRP